MFCPTGLELFETYQAAENAKNSLRARRDSPLIEGQLIPARELVAAKQQYVEHFANWLAHKAFCQDCKPKAPSKGEQRSTAPGK